LISLSVLEERRRVFTRKSAIPAWIRTSMGSIVLAAPADALHLRRFARFEGKRRQN
jgi:hypothetical protein